MIAYASNLEGNFDIYTMTAAGTENEQLTTDTGEDVQPNWGGGTPQLARIAEGSEIQLCRHSRQQVPIVRWS
jgi:hypothetical protein